MAASLCRRSFVFCKQIKPNIRCFHHAKSKNLSLNISVFIGVPCVTLGLLEARRRSKKNGHFIPVVHAAKATDSEKTPPSHVMTYRELKFQQFASVQYDGIIYMTPQDFLESVTEDSPRQLRAGASARIGRRTLTENEIESMLRNTPPRKKGSRSLFRSMHNNGIISYTEYLFLLCVLTKPQSGFRIAFNMFDTDGNQIVDKKEFLVLESFFTLPPHERKFVPRGKKHLQALLDLESVFSKQRENKKRLSGKDAQETVDPIQDTTLLIHFFGKRGNDVLKYDDFNRFVVNLQSEVIELEFLEFSKGMQTISEEDFARILLRYTNLEKAEIGECLTRVRNRMPEEKGISFQEFKQFCQFMNSIDDFTIAMNMYTYANRPVSREEFQRAVKVSTGNTLDSHIVDTVFNIFDVDGDGHLSYREFISIMKDRMHRGSKSRVMHNLGHWDSFKSCVKNEMKSY